MATTTTTTTTTATVGGGTTVDNLNILDTSKTNDLGSLEIITWADVAAALGSTTNATQTQTIQSAFTNGQLNLTFQLAANVYYTIDHTAAGYMIIQTDQYGFQSGQFDAYTNQTVSLATSPVPLPTPLQSPTISLSTFLTNVGSFLGQASALITADLDGGSGKDVIQGIVGDGSLSTGSIHNIIQGGTGADVLTRWQRIGFLRLHVGRGFRGDWSTESQRGSGADLGPDYQLHRSKHGRFDGSQSG